MRKFLSKLPTMITFLVLAGVVAGLTVGILLRPIAYGFIHQGNMYGFAEAIPVEFVVNHDSLVITAKSMPASVIEQNDVDFKTLEYYIGNFDGHQLVYYGLPVKMDGKAVDGVTLDEIKVMAQTAYDNLKAEGKLDQLLAGNIDRNFHYEDGSWEMVSDGIPSQLAIFDRFTDCWYASTYGDNMSDHSIAVSGLCVGSIIWTASMSTVGLIFLTFGIVSMVFFLKTKKGVNQ